MTFSVLMPALGESVTEGTVARWLKQEGDSVEIDEPLLEVSSDKVDTEIPAPATGVLQKIVVPEDGTVEVGAQLAVIRVAADDGMPAPTAVPPAAQAATPVAPAPVAATALVATAPVTSDGAGDTNGSGAPYVTPLVRKLAAENGIDLASVPGTGRDGRIRKQDVQAAIEAARQPAPVAAPAVDTASAALTEVSADAAEPRGTTQKLTRLRQIVAQRTRESLQVSAQLTQVVEVDVTRIAKLRARAKADFEQRVGIKLTFLPFFAKATVEALTQHPKLNASINEEAREATYHDTQHLGIAVDTERGLLNAVIHNAGDLNLAGLAHKITDIAARTRANKVPSEELVGGTFSLTNLGSNGALFDTPIIQQPQVGILGVGLVEKRPVAVIDADGDDTIAIPSMVYLALTYDHRLVDGADAGRFLTTIKNRLQGGAFEADLGL